MSATLRSRAHVLLLASGLAIGCKKTEEKVEAPESSSAAGVVVGDREVVTIEHPAQMLPQGTQAVFWVAGVQRVAEIFERDRLKETFPNEYEMARLAMTSEIGYDLLDPASYAAAGIDPGGRMGAAVIDAQQEAFALFFTLSDTGKFKQAVRTIAGKAEVELAEAPMAASTVLRDPRGQAEVAVVLRDAFAVVLIQEKAREGEPERFDYTDYVAKLDPRESLAASVQYRKSLGGLRDTDAMAFVDARRLVDAAIAEMDEDIVRNQERKTEAPASHMEQELADAKARGASSEEIEEIERAIQEDKSWEARWERRQAAQRELLDTIFQGVEGIGMAISNKRTGPVFDGQVVLTSDAWARQAFVGGEGRLKMPHALNGEPLFYLGGRVDPTKAAEFLDMVVRADGEESWYDVSKEGKEEIFGVDLDAELRPQLTGEAGFALTLEAPIDYAHMDELAKQIGMSMYGEISDREAVDALLGRAAASDTKVGRKLEKKAGVLTLPIEEFRTMYVGTNGSTLVASTDKTLGGRMTSGEDGSIIEEADPPSPYYVLTLPNAAAAFAMDFRLIMGTFGVLRGSMPGPTAFMSGPDGEPWEEVEKARMSKKAKAKKAELDAAHDKLRAAENEQEGAEAKRMFDAITPLGTTAFVVQPNERGLAVSGGQFLRAPSASALVETLVNFASGGNMRSEGDFEKINALQEDVSRLTQEYQELRLKDYAKYSKGGRGGSKGPKKTAAAPKPRAKRASGTKKQDKKAAK